MVTHYERLGVPPDAGPDQVRAGYRRVVKHLHPDATGGDAAAFVEATTAYETLRDPSRRAAYDRESLGRPVLSPAVLDLGTLAADTRASRTVRVTNAGVGEPVLALDRDAGTGWRIASASGSTRPGAVVELVIVFDPSGLEGRTVAETLTVSFGEARASLAVRFSVARTAATIAGTGTSVGAVASRPGRQRPLPDPLPGWGFILERGRWTLVLAAAACGLLAPLLLYLALEEQAPAAAILVGVLLAIGACIAVLRSQLFDPSRLVVAGRGDQAAILAVAGTGMGTLVAVAIVVVLAVLLAIIVVGAVLGVLAGLASSKD
jgi:hypothetical protein